MCGPDTPVLQPDAPAGKPIEQQASAKSNLESTNLLLLGRGEEESISLNYRDFLTLSQAYDCSLLDVTRF